MSRHYQRLHHQLLSSLLLSLLVLSYLPARAYNDPGKQPATETRSPQQSGRARSQPAPARNSGFLSAPATGDPLQIALSYLRAHKFELGLTDADLAEIVVKDRYISKHNGVTHLYLRQRLNGIELFNGDININIMPDGRIVNLGNRFVSDLSSKVKNARPSLDAIATLRSVAGQLKLPITSALVATASARGTDQATQVSSGGISVAPIPMRLIYQALENGKVKLAWNMVIQPPNSSDWFDIRADATSGEILSKVNWTSDAAPVQHESVDQSPAAMPATAPSAGAVGDSYLVFPLPFESPFEGSSSQVYNPADDIASPYGWHDTDGVAGPEFNTTQGNNAFAYADLVAPDGFTAGDATTTATAGQTFTHTADFNQPPATNQDAAITNLFYVTNRVHDILYRYGFDEGSGNFQSNNYGNGGMGNDAVKAEAQDYSGINNANFSTPADGLQPRMQMYLGGAVLSFTVSSPISIAGAIDSISASFGPLSFDVSGDVALIDDGDSNNGGSITDGCQSITNNISGKIALIDRGSCNFKVKVYNAQLAGAIAVIVANNDNPPPSGMSDDDSVPTVTIPSLLILKPDAQAIKAELASPVSVRMEGVQRDGSFDNGVILHEYGHGVSNRLTGGPANASCLSTEESGGLGEGWSDFIAMALTAKASDTATKPIILGRWLVGNHEDGAGIRHYPYTTDMNVNPQTFATTWQVNPSTGDIGEVHDVGEVWAAMLWEVYWNLVDDYGFDEDLFNGISGNNLALQLVLDGMKFQPCAPSFIDARNAILIADYVDTDGSNQCRIWEGFAKRGLGFSAEAGTSSTVEDGVEAFDLPSWCMVDVQPPVVNVCAPNDAVYDIALGESFIGAATLSVSNVPTDTSSNISPNPISAPTHATLTLGTTGVVTPGNYWIDIIGTGSSQIYTTTVAFNLAVTTPDAPLLSAPLDGETDVSDAPWFSWQPLPTASEYRFEVAADAEFTDLIYSTTTTSTDTDIPFYLRSARTYWWRVTAQNGCGESATTTASFTVRTFPSVLLVDDDGSGGWADVGMLYEDVLSELNISYDYWDTGDNGTFEPSRLDDIADYSTIIWFNGFIGAAPEPETEPVLAQYLDEGKCFFINAQDYYYNRGLTPFMHDYLGVEEATDDLSDGLTWHSVITGTEPIFGNLGPYTLLYPTDNYSDLITPTVGAGVAFVGNAGNAAVYKDGGNYRTTYWGFEYENLPTPEALLDTMQRVLDFCTFQSDLGITQEMTPQSTLSPGQPITYTLTYSNSGVGTAQGVMITATVPAALAELAVVSEGATITPSLAAPYQWQLDDLAPGQSGIITVTGVVSPLLNGDVNLIFASSIGTSTFDKNLSNNQTTPITVTAIVPRIQLASPSTTVSEDAGVAALVLTLDHANPYAPVQVAVVSSDNSALAGSDYTSISGTAIVPAGAISSSFALSITDDSEIELAESLTVQLQNPGGATLGIQQSSQVTITDNDLPSVRFASSDFSALESTGYGTILVELDRPHPFSAVTVDYLAQDGSAKAGFDYSDNSGQLTFPAGTSTLTVTLSVAADGEVEDGETVALSLGNPVNALLGTQPTATLTIRDRDYPLVRFTETSYTKSEADQVAVVAVELDQPNLTDVVSVTYSTSDGSASAGADYLTSSGVLTFALGETSRSISIALIDDTDVELDETLQLNLLNATNGLVDIPAETEITITDDDVPQVAFASEVYSATESSGGISITVKLDRPQPYQSVSVGYSTSAGTAQADSDYTNVSGIVTFPAGKTTAEFFLPILEDTLVENAETVLLTLANPNGLELGSVVNGTLFISDSDLPSAHFSSASYAASEVDGLVTATIVLDQANPRGDVVIGYTTHDASALAESDYAPLTGVVTIAKGSLSAAIPLTVLNDSDVESSESFFVEQTSFANAVAGSPISAEVTIASEDVLPAPMLKVAVSANRPSGEVVYVGDEIHYTLGISNSGGPASNLVVTVTVPTNTLYLTGSSTPGPEIVPSAAESRMKDEQLLVWRIPSLGANESVSITYGLKMIAAADMLKSSVAMLVDGQALDVSNSLQYVVEAARKVFMPLINR